MPIIQRTKSASFSGQQYDTTSKAITINEAIAIVIALVRFDLLSPIETLLLSPLITMITLSVFFTDLHLLVIIGPHMRGLPNPLITQEIAAVYHIFAPTQIRLPKQNCFVCSVSVV